MASIQVPYNFTAREYQKPLYNCLPNGFNRGIAVWHRRAGKDKTFMAIIARETFKRVGTYFYILPYYKQARSIIWEGMDKDGFKMLHHVPPALVKKQNNQDMSLEMVNGSILKLIGSDNIDSIVGTNPLGIVFSEFSLHKISAWDYLRPILLENNGWALFNGTPRGKNHLYHMLKTAQKDESWFTDIKTIDDTGVMTAAQVEEEIANGMPRALAMQEFYCSFEAALVGAYYDEMMTRMVQDKRIGRVPWESGVPVHTAWDLGISDQLIILFYQQVAKEIRIIDMVKDNGKGLDYYVKRMQELPYVYGTHALPHDVKVRELSNGKSRLQTLYELGLNNIYVVPKASIEDGINATRRILSRTFIDENKCDSLIEALKSYRANWDEEKRLYTTPVHDEFSHEADAMRILSQAVRDEINANNLPPVAEGTMYDPLGPSYSYKPANHEFNGRWNPRDYQTYESMDSRFRQ